MISLEPGEGAIRRRKIPESLRGKRVTARDILDWAREQLAGMEPDLGKDLISRIKAGEITEVVLRPKKPGFFGPDGTFIEAFEYTPAFGEDLDEAQKHWDLEEEDRLWVDAENVRFNKTVVENHRRIGEAMWQHGSRIETYAKRPQGSVSAILHLLDRRKGPDGYARHSHQTCLDFYRWKPGLQVSDPILDWKWERIDAVLRFSSKNQVRDHLQAILDSTPLGELRDDKLTRLLGIKTRQPDELLQPEDAALLQELRSQIRRLGRPGPELIAGSIRIIETTRKRETAELGNAGD